MCMQCLCGGMSGKTDHALTDVCATGSGANDFVAYCIFQKSLLATLLIVCIVFVEIMYSLHIIVNLPSHFSVFIV